MEMVRTSEVNDCSVCATLNVARALGIEVSRDEIKNAVGYHPEHGGSQDRGLKYIASKYGLLQEIYPLPKDLVYEQITESRRQAKPEVNKETIFKNFIKRLQDGWVAVFQHNWDGANLDHAVALIGTTDDAIRVACSVRGEYLVDQEFFHNRKRGTLQGVFTFWVKQVIN